MKLQVVNPNYICQIWGKVSDMIVNGLKHSGGEYSADQLKMYLVRGEQTLLIAENESGIKGAATVQFINYPNDRVCFITAIGGRMIANNEMFNQLTDWAKAQGCTKIQGAAFESVARLWRQRFGVTERYRIVEKTL